MATKVCLMTPPRVSHKEVLGVNEFDFKWDYKL